MTDYPKTMWRLKFGGIEKVTVIGETNSYWIIENNNWKNKSTDRCKKGSWAGVIFPTWEDAHKMLIEGCENIIKIGKANLREEEKRLEHLKNLKPPE